MIDLGITIDTAAARQMLDAMTDARTYQQMAEAVADEVVLPALHKYPPPSRKPMRFKSARQRAFVIAAIRSGDIRVPYVRTGAYGRSFEKQPISNGLALVSHLAYAPYVRGGDVPQAEYHKNTWSDLETLAQELEGDAALAATAALIDATGAAGP